MDNLCHTLVGAALGEAGLKRRTRFGQAALMISANLPDLDVLVFATDIVPVSFRRGWTHGIAAQVVLPALLTLAFAIVARRRRVPGVRAGWLLTLSYIGVYSHVFLDFLNNYGIRLLAPVDWRWFYGDAVFIIDPVLWAALGTGVWMARRRQAARPAAGALAVAGGYILLMLLSAQAARDYVIEAWRTSHGVEPRGAMVGPQLLTPFARQVIVDAGDRYEYGVFSWLPPGLTLVPDAIQKNAHRPEVAAAIASSEEVRGFLVWSRFPYWTIERVEEGARVTVRDMRFAGRGGFTASAIVPASAY